MHAMLIFGVVITFMATVIIVLKIREFIIAGKARKRARELGIKLQKTTRQVPYWTSHDLSQPPKFKKKNRFAYSIQCPEPTGNQWKLLQRENNEESDFPPAWRLDIISGSIGEELKKILIQIAAEFEAGYLEIEATSDSVCIYWRECGGIKMADKLFAYLNDICRMNKTSPSD